MTQAEEEIRQAIRLDRFEDDITMCGYTLRGSLLICAQQFISYEELVSAVDPQMLADVYMEGIVKKILQNIRTQEHEEEVARLRNVQALCYTTPCDKKRFWTTSDD